MARDLVKIRRGLKEDLPILALGEMAFTTDTEQLCIGGMNGNVLYNITDNLIDLKNYGVVGDGITDDHEKIQQCFDSLNDGDTLVISKPSNFYYVINATGQGVSYVEQRQNALINNTLKPLVISKSNLKIIIEGDIKASSLLGDLIKITGKNNTIIGNGGSIKGMGGSDLVGFYDVNSQDPTQQWLPSLICVDETAETTIFEKIKIVDPPTLGIKAYSKIMCFNNVFEGGRVTHGTGTVLMGVALYNGSDNSYIYKNKFTKNALGGKQYSNVYNLSTKNIIVCNEFEDAHEHNIYAYNDFLTIENNQMNMLNPVASSIQVFGKKNKIIGNIIHSCMSGGIAIEKGTDTIIENNMIYDCGLSGISFRDFMSSTEIAENVKIINNHVVMNKSYIRQSGIDVQSDYPINHLVISGNVIENCPASLDPSIKQAIVIRAFNPSRPFKWMTICDNVVKNSDGYGCYLGNISKMIFKNNYFIDNATDGNTNFQKLGVILTNTLDCLFIDNVFEDTRQTPINTYAIYEDTGCDRNELINNKAYGFISGVTRIVGASTIVKNYSSI